MSGKNKISFRLLVLCILQVLVIGLFPGCSSDSGLSGYWLSEEADFSAEFNSYLDKGIEETDNEERRELLELMKVESFPIRTEYYFGEDGEWFVQLQQSSCKSAVADAKVLWKENTVTHFEKRLEEIEEYSSVDELFEAEDMDVDTFVKTFISQYLEEFIGSNSDYGRYKTDGTKILFGHESDDGTTVYDVTAEYTLDGDSLTIGQPVNDDGTVRKTGQTVEYPLELTRSEETGD